MCNYPKKKNAMCRHRNAVDTPRSNFIGPHRSIFSKPPHLPPKTPTLKDLSLSKWHKASFCKPWNAVFWTTLKPSSDWKQRPRPRLSRFSLSRRTWRQQRIKKVWFFFYRINISRDIWDLILTPGLYQKMRPRLRSAADQNLKKISSSTSRHQTKDSASTSRSIYYNTIPTRRDCASVQYYRNRDHPTPTQRCCPWSRRGQTQMDTRNLYPILKHLSQSTLPNPTYNWHPYPKPHNRIML